MSNFLAGCLLGVTLAAVLFFVWHTLIEDILYDCKHIKAIRSLVIAFLFLVVILGGSLGVYVSRCVSVADGRQFEAQKLTIETSLRSDNLTGMERAALVSEAARYNGELAKKQYKASKWYGFDISDEILNLEPIQFE